MNNHRASLGFLQRRKVFPVIQKADVFRSRKLQRRNPGQHHPSGRRLPTGGIGHSGESMGTRALEKTRISRDFGPVHLLQCFCAGVRDLAG
jgi:hypothetical protein